MPFYAVRRGRNPGVYKTWPECQEQTVGFKGPVFKKFETEEMAWDFVNNISSDVDGLRRNLFPYVLPAASEICYFTLEQSRASASDFEASSSDLCEALNMLRASVLALRSAAEGILLTLGTVNTQIERLTSSLGARSSNMSNVAGSKDQEKEKLKRSKSDETPTGSGEPPLKKSKSAGSTTETDGAFTGTPFLDKEGTPVYTDGASFRNGQAGAVAGIGVFWGEDNPNNVSKPLEGRQTNNRAEIHAAVVAVEQAKKSGIKNLILHTDSNFLINGITSWIKGWKKRGWKLSSGGPVVNREDFEELDKSLEGMNVKWVFVRGHKGNPGNEAADRLANEGAKKNRPGK